MDVFGTVVGALEIIEKISIKISQYREADEVIKSIARCLRNVKVRMDIFREYLLHADPSLSPNARGVLKGTVGHINDLLQELNGEELPLVQRLAWIGWRKRRVEGLVLRLKNVDEDVHRTVFALDILSKVRGNDLLFKRLFDTGERSLTVAWALSKRIHSSDNDLLPSLPIPEAAISFPYGFTFEHDRSIGSIANHGVYIEAHNVENMAMDPVMSTARLRRMAAVFTSVDLPSMHILSCAGFVLDYAKNRFCFVYHLPKQIDLRRLPHQPVFPSLAYAFRRGVPMKLEDRFRIAVEVATAVFEMHKAGWVHKSIRSDNILLPIYDLAPGDINTQEIGTAYLIGFVDSRLQADGSISPQDDDTWKRRYHHPERHDEKSSAIGKFDIRHDMYSLAAVLIEIGYQQTLSDIFKQDSVPRAWGSGGAKGNHRALVHFAGQLVYRMGSKYAGAALACLLKTTERDKRVEAVREEFYLDVMRPLREVLDGHKALSDSLDDPPYASLK